jgi:arginine N-succinyltransferase
MLKIRPARSSDVDALLDLADRVGPGMTTLPPNREVLAQRAAVSQASFMGERSGSGTAYVLLLEDTETNSVLGSAAVYPQVGTEFGFFSYKLSRLKHRSDLVSINREIPVLNLVNDFTGWTEVGSLVVAPEARRGGLGRLLARSRYLLIAQFPELFGEHVFAEMRGWQEEDGRSPFWSAVGERFFDLEFAAADRLSAVEGSRFIQELIPKHPIYLQLLDEGARDCIGRPHASSRAAMELLLKEGFRYEGYVDVFDAGPQVQARPAEIATVRNSRLLRVLPGEVGEDGDEAMVAAASLSCFAVGLGEVRVERDGVVLSQALRLQLQAAEGEEMRVCLL